MKRSCLALVGVLVLMGASLARADGNPNLTLTGNQHDGFFVTGLSFDFTTATGSGNPCTVGATNDANCVFTNDSGVAWESLIFTVTGNDDSPLSCSTTFRGFSKCSISGDMITFSGGLGIGITEFPGDDFQVILNGFSRGTNFSVQAIPAATPEPSALLMLGCGLLGIGGLLRRRFAKAS